MSLAATAEPAGLAGTGRVGPGQLTGGESAWADALQALALFAMAPFELGGVSLRAGPGPVRELWLTLLQDALPLGTQLRRIPLHVCDERLLGGLDLVATLQAGRPIAQHGLLCEADGGVVLLAMAERVEPAAAARLCSALDDGAVTLQRDGLSRRSAARFGIVALDEGLTPDEHPPTALLDRLAFHLDLTQVSHRDIQASAWCDRQPEADGDINAIPPAAIYGSDDAVQALCSTGLALGISSIRAPLLALRAARFAAARSGREQLTEADLSLVARLVLVPRATRLPLPEDAEAPAEPEPPPASETTEPEAELPLDRPLEDVVLDAAKAALPADLLARLAALEAGQGAARAPGRAGASKTSMRRGRPIGCRQGAPTGHARLHLMETLKAAAPWQSLRRRLADEAACLAEPPAAGIASGPPRFQVRRDDLRIIRFRQRIGATTVFAVDASGSAAMHRLGEAKGAVELLLAECYVRRDQVALLSFRGQGATVLLPPTGSLLRAKRSLAGLAGGGPTPLAAGIDAAVALADSVRRSGRTPVITLLTDARANVARDGTGVRQRAEADAIASAQMLRATGVATLLVDTSPRPNPFARRLAEAMRAQYIPLPYVDAQALTHAVRAAAAA